MREISKKIHKNAVFYLKIKQVYFTHKSCIFRNFILYDQHNISVKNFARALRRASFFNIIWVNIIFCISAHFFGKIWIFVMLKNDAQWCMRQKNYKIKKHIIKSYFDFNIGSIEPNYAYLLFKKKKFFFHPKTIRKMREISKKIHKNAVFYLKLSRFILLIRVTYSEISFCMTNIIFL